MEDDLSPEKLALMQANEVMLGIMQFWMGALVNQENVEEKLALLREKLNDAAFQVMGIEFERESE